MGFKFFQRGNVLRWFSEKQAGGLGEKILFGGGE